MNTWGSIMLCTGKFQVNLDLASVDFQFDLFAIPLEKTNKFDRWMIMEI